MLCASGRPSRNPNWNYAQSGPLSFQTTGGVFAPMQHNMTSMSVNPMSAVTTQTTSEIALVLERLQKLEQVEALKVATAAAEAEAKKKKEEWDKQLKEVRETCVESARKEMSPKYQESSHVATRCVSC